MPELPPTKFSVRTAALFASALVVTCLFLLSSRRTPKHLYSSNSIVTTTKDLFAAEYPVSIEFTDELHQLRQTGKLKPQNEERIDESIRNVSRHLKIPASLLWCTTFHQSRFDHLLGMGNEQSAHGLSRFYDSDFFEFNHQLDRYARTNVKLMLDVLGRDIRPVTLDSKDIFSDSSYFSIPTAVVSTAAALNNRFSELDELLRNQNIVGRNDILWFYSSLAYEGGMRAVTALLDEIGHQDTGGSIYDAVNSPSFFLRLIHDESLYQRAFRRVWTNENADLRSDSLFSYANQLARCSVSPPPGQIRIMANEGSVLR
jgi:hypothetical protein